MRCCSTFTNLGCISACAPIDLGLNTLLEPFTLTLELDYLGTVISQSITALHGEPYLFDMPKNENYDYTGRIVYDDGTSMCISFTTFPLMTVA